MGTRTVPCSSWDRFSRACAEKLGRTELRGIQAGQSTVLVPNLSVCMPRRWSRCST